VHLPQKSFQLLNAVERPYAVEFNRKLIKKGPNVQLKIDHVLNPTCLVIRQEAQGDHNGHDLHDQKAEVARQVVAERDREEDRAYH
jgi:hypothetical protein